jgi:anaerobic magnesium-protoporphyrin IX monomethyl ester cyclase
MIKIRGAKAMKRMKVLLIAIYSEAMNKNLEEMGICFITSYLRNNDYEVMLLGLFEKEIDYQKISDFKPDIIGMPVYSHSKDAVCRFSSKVKQLMPAAYTCVGGFLPTFYGVELLGECPQIDFAIRGEGEEVWLDLLSRLEQNEGLDKVKGLIFRQGDEIIVNDKQMLINDLNSLSFPSRDLLVDNKLQIAQIASSRGCSGRCSFCCCPSFWQNNGKHKWRGREISKMLDEMEYLIKSYGINSFSLIDNSFEDPGSNFQKVWDVAQGIINRKLEVYYYLCFRAEFHKKITKELIDLLKKSGLCSVYLGIEAANENDLNVFNKIASVEDNIKAIKLFKESQINITIGFINFNPYSTFDGLRKNIDFLEEYGYASHFIHIRRTRVFKGTTLYEKLEKDGLLRDGGYCDDYRYNYVDARIMHLANFLGEYFEGDKTLSPVLLNTSDFYANDYLVILTSFKKRLEKLQDTKAQKLVCDHELDIIEILSDLNKRNAAWFRELLELAEHNWEQEAALQIMNKYLDNDYARKIMDSLENERTTFFTELSRINPTFLF